MDVVVARIGKPHGVRGEVTVHVRTDDPQRRLAVGATLRTQPASRGPVTITGNRRHKEIVLLTLEGVADRDAAEELRNTLLLAEPESSADNDEWHPHELQGWAVTLADGTAVGEVVDLLVGPAQDIVVVSVAGEEYLVPFVTEIVPTIDEANRTLIVDPPAGLLPLPGEPATDAPESGEPLSGGSVTGDPEPRDPAVGE